MHHHPRTHRDTIPIASMANRHRRGTWLLLVATSMLSMSCSSTGSQERTAETPPEPTAESTPAPTAIPDPTAIPAAPPTAPPTASAEPVAAAEDPPLDETPIEGMQIEANGLLFDAIVAGPATGDMVMLLHGFPLKNTQWNAQVEALAAAGYRVVAPNLRGYSPGAQPDDVSEYSIDLVAADLMAIADALNTDTFHLVGHDYGAVAAWHAAATSPDRIISMTSISSPHPDALAAAANDPATDQAMRLASFLPLFTTDGTDIVLLGDDASLLRNVILASAGMGSSELDQLVAFLSTGSTMQNTLNFFRAGGLDAAAPPLGVVDVPVMYIWGQQDPQLGPDAAAGTADFVTGDYRYEVLDVNHWVTHQASDQVTALLLSHLEGF